MLVPFAPLVLSFALQRRIFSALFAPITRRSGVVVALMCFFVGRATGVSAVEAGSDFFFDTFGTELGLPQTNVVAAVQTRDGYLWVGTQGGLARFDGARFVSFRASNTPGLTNHAIRSLFEDRAGSLWIGTENGLFRRRAGRFERIGELNTAVTAFAEDRAGTIWIGTSTQGLFQWRNGRLESLAGDPLLAHLGSIRCLFVDTQDRLWMGVLGWLGAICGEKGVFRVYDGGGRLHHEIQTICETPGSTLWFGTHTQGIFRLKDGVLDHHAIRTGQDSAPVVALWPGRSGGLWFVAGGVHFVSDLDRFNRITVAVPPSETVAGACEDREGSIWLCAREDGLIRARRAPYRSITVAEGLPSNAVKTVSQDAAGNLWLAVQHHGIVKVDTTGAVTVLSEKDGLPGHDPSLVFAASDGAVWTGVGSRLCVWRDGQCTTVPEVHLVKGIYEDRKGVIWIGTDNREVLRYDHGAFQRVSLDPQHPIAEASSFSEAADGAMYIAARGAGIFRVNDGRVTLFDRSTGLPTNEVRAVYFDREGRLWVGMKGRGLALFENGRWLNPDALSEDFADHVSGIIEDDQGQLWLGTPSGVMWAAKDDLVAVARGERAHANVRIAGMSDGAHIAPVWSGGQPNMWKTPEGKLLFATRRGVLVIDPAHTPINAVPPPVHVESVSIDGRIVSGPADVRVPAGARAITIEYTALTSLQPSRVFFKYKLDGYDADWTDAGPRRTVTYENLKSGGYVFRMKACNSDGVWNELGEQIAIVQAPHFYETWWFYGFALAGAAAAALGFYRWRTAALRWENERLERKISERTRELELANTAKSEFLESVSHEIRNPLNGLNGLLGLLKRQTLDGVGRELANSLQACARSLTRVFDEVLNYSKLEYGIAPIEETAFSLRRLLTEVIESFTWQAAQQSNRIHLRMTDDLPDGFVGDERKIKTIVGNFVANAIKYAPATDIDVRVEMHAAAAGSSEVHIEVCDRGPGVPVEEQELIFKKFVRGTDARKAGVAGTGLGLATCRALARLLNGSVGVDSEPGRGAVFYLRVPLRLASAVPSEHDDAAPLADGPQGKALIVDDGHYNQVVLKGIALELGYAPEIASNAEQSEALLAAHAFDVVFLDWELPGLKGGDVARAIRARPGGMAPIIVAVTAHDSAEIRRECENAGMDAYLLKPYDLEQVKGCIARVRARRRGASEPETSRPEPALLSLAAFAHYARGVSGDIGTAARLYMENVVQELARIEAARLENDGQQLAAVAHQIRALGGLVGAKDVCFAAQTLETQARTASPELRQSLCVALARELVRLQIEIADLTGTSAVRA